VKESSKKKRIGIFRGTFDPIHMGHLAFASEATLSAKLDCVYFLPEKTPKHKKTVENFTNRLAMISHAISPYPNMRLLELHSMGGSIVSVLPELRNIIGNAQVVFLMGSDVAKTIHQWPDSDSLCDGNELFIGMRQGDSISKIKNMLNSLAVKPTKVVIVNAPNPTAASSAIRKKFNQNTPSKDLPKSVHSLAAKKQFYKTPSIQS